MAVSLPRRSRVHRFDNHGRGSEIETSARDLSLGAEPPIVERVSVGTLPGNQELDQRIKALEAIARGLSRAQLAEFIAGVRNAPKLSAWPAGEAFWYQGTNGVKLTNAENHALERLWARMLAGLAFAVSGERVEEWIARPGWLARLDRLLEPRPWLQIEVRATTVLERTMSGDIWQGVIGIWNAFCAALLVHRLERQLSADLQAVWVSIFGQAIEIDSVPIGPGLAPRFRAGPIGYDTRLRGRP